MMGASVVAGELTFDPIIKALKPGGKIGNVNHLGSGQSRTIPRVEWDAEWVTR